MEIVLYDRELEVMQVLWDSGPATVAEVRATLEDEMAYNTVLTVLRRLEDKGYVAHEEEGRAHRYHPLIERQQVRESALERLTGRLFQGSPELLLTHLVSARQLSESQLRRLRELVDDQLEEDR
ncbi:BlaI/MecI/CopY family transcriptional regulator [soil metagenome]